MLCEVLFFRMILVFYICFLVDLGLGIGDRCIVKMYFLKVLFCVREVLCMKKVDIGWDLSVLILYNVDIKFEIGMWLVIFGLNGVGKSMFMCVMVGRGGVFFGFCEVGEGVEIGVFI